MQKYYLHLEFQNGQELEEYMGQMGYLEGYGENCPVSITPCVRRWKKDGFFAILESKREEALTEYYDYLKQGNEEKVIGFEMYEQ